MQVEELSWTRQTGWCSQRGSGAERADLVIYFGDRDALQCGTRFGELRAAYPHAHIIGGSATATILGDELNEHNVAAVALSFAHTRIAVAQCEGISGGNSGTCGEAIGRRLIGPELAGVFVLADGVLVNGHSLTEGLNHVLGGVCPIIGGMTTDPYDYAVALAGADAPPASGVVAAVGFYGRNIRLSPGYACGWDAFGPRRLITRVSGNALHELDNRPAVELYQRYLGEELETSSHAGELFPLLMSPPDHPEHKMVRAILHIDQSSGTINFAHDVPEGWMARLMRGNVDRLAQAAGDAARQARCGLPETTLGERLALMVTCTGRFRLMGQRTVEEIAFARDELGSDMRCLGFYSNGEIASVGASGTAALHNQTMTIVGLAEIEG